MSYSITIYPPSQLPWEALEHFSKTLYPNSNATRSQINEDYLQELAIVYTANQEIIATACLYYNPYIQKEGQVTYLIGNFEALPQHVTAVELLFENLFHNIKEKGGTFVIGPMNGSTWDNYRFKTEHRHTFLSDLQHPNYYPQYWENVGFLPLAHYSSNIDTTLAYDFPDILVREQELLQQGLHIRQLDLNQYEKELERIYTFNLTAFKTNLLYSPISKTHFLEKYLPLKPLIQPQFVSLAENSNQELIGYYFCLPDVYEPHQLIIKTLARIPSTDWEGLGKILANQIYRTAIQEGYTKIIHAFMYQHGYSKANTQKFSGTLANAYILYGQTL